MAARMLRSAFVLILFGIPLATFAAPQSAVPGAAPERKVASIHPGSISGDIYTNPFFGFSMEIPQGWKVADDSAMQALIQKNKDTLAQQPQWAPYVHNGEVDSPLLVIGEREPTSGGQHRRLIQILCTDVSERPGQPSADEFLKFAAEASLHSGPFYEYSDTLERVTLDGREFWKMYFTQKGSILWHGAHFLRWTRHTCFSLFS